MNDQSELVHTTWVKRAWPPKDPRWEINLKFEVVVGQVKCTGFSIEAAGKSDATFNASLLRSIPLSRIIRETLSYPSQDLLELAGKPKINRLADLRESGIGPLKERPEAKKTTSGRRGRPTKYSEDHYRNVASLYRSHLHSPTLQIAKAYGVNRTTAANWVRKARSLGFLAPADSLDDGGVEQ